MEVKTVIRNDTPAKLSLKVGNAMAYTSLLSPLRQGELYVIAGDFADTYQEFMFGTSPSDQKVIVSSDDCTEYVVVSHDTDIARAIAAALDAMGDKLNMVHAQVERQNSYLRRGRLGCKFELLLYIVILLQAAILVHSFVSAP